MNRYGVLPCGGKGAFEHIPTELPVTRSYACGVAFGVGLIQCVQGDGFTVHHVTSHHFTDHCLTLSPPWLNKTALPFLGEIQACSSEINTWAGMPKPLCKRRIMLRVRGRERDRIS